MVSHETSNPQTPLEINLTAQRRGYPEAGPEYQVNYTERDVDLVETPLTQEPLALSDFGDPPTVPVIGDLWIGEHRLSVAARIIVEAPDSTHNLLAHSQPETTEPSEFLLVYAANLKFPDEPVHQIGPYDYHATGWAPWQKAYAQAGYAIVDVQALRRSSANGSSGFLQKEMKLVSMDPTVGTSMSVDSYGESVVSEAYYTPRPHIAITSDKKYVPTFQASPDFKGQARIITGRPLSSTYTPDFSVTPKPRNSGASGASSGGGSSRNSQTGQGMFGEEYLTNEPLARLFADFLGMSAVGRAFAGGLGFGGNTAPQPERPEEVDPVAKAVQDEIEELRSQGVDDTRILRKFMYHSHPDVAQGDPEATKRMAYATTILRPKPTTPPIRGAPEPADQPTASPG